MPEESRHDGQPRHRVPTSVVLRRHNRAFLRDPAVPLSLGVALVLFGAANIGPRPSQIAVTAALTGAGLIVIVVGIVKVGLPPRPHLFPLDPKRLLAPWLRYYLLQRKAKRNVLPPDNQYYG